MYTTYNLFKFLHIVAVIIWIGGLIAVSVLNMRLARKEDRAALAAMARQSRFLGTLVVGPAAGITLIAGIVMMVVSGLTRPPLWIIWGFTAILLSLALGATLLRRAGVEFERVATDEHGDPRLISLQRRLATLNAINVLLLLSAVWAMVFKPTL